MLSPRLPASPPSTKLVNFRSAHPPEKGVKTLSVTLLDVRHINTKLTVGVGELEGVEERGGSLEVGSTGDDLVDEVLDTDDRVLAQRLLNLSLIHI